MRNVLVGSLLAWVDGPQRAKTRRFLRGLSSDELQFIAGFCGACILESGWGSGGMRAQVAIRIADYQNRRHPSEDLKIVLLLEYLNRSGLHQVAIPAR